MMLMTQSMTEVQVEGTNEFCLRKNTQDYNPDWTNSSYRYSYVSPLKDHSSEKWFKRIKKCVLEHMVVAGDILPY